MPANDSNNANDQLVFADDDPDDQFAPPPQESAPWRILIVDDDVDVHVVTKFALSNTNFQGRRLCFLHAYTGEEALAIMRNTPDVAMVLLDVIMETPEAGLHVARHIRTELHNQLVRIVLRTGQPGQGLEHCIIVDYDINDFWCKADLTTRKLFTTVITSLRAYATLVDATTERAALSAELAQAGQLQQVLDQHALILTVDAQGNIVDANDMLCRTAGLERMDLIGRHLNALQRLPLPEPLRAQIDSALASDGAWSGDISSTDAAGAPLLLRCAVRSFTDQASVPSRYVAVATVIPPP